MPLTFSLCARATVGVDGREDARGLWSRSAIGTYLGGSRPVCPQKLNRIGLLTTHPQPAFAQGSFRLRPFRLRRTRRRGTPRRRRVCPWTPSTLLFSSRKPHKPQQTSSLSIRRRSGRRSDRLADASAFQTGTSRACVSRSRGARLERITRGCKGSLRRPLPGGSGVENPRRDGCPPDHYPRTTPAYCVACSAPLVRAFAHHHSTVNSVASVPASNWKASNQTVASSGAGQIRIERSRNRPPYSVDGVSTPSNT